MTRRLPSAVVLAALALLAAAPVSAAPAPVATVVVDGVISPVTLRLVESAITRAKAGGAQALVIQLDTPGGLERSMRAICQRLLNAEIPVVVWVGPTGARKFFAEEVIRRASTALPSGRMARPEEIARGILFWVDPESEYITGSTLAIDGGSQLPWWSRRGTGDF